MRLTEDESWSRSDTRLAIPLDEHTVVAEMSYEFSGSCGRVGLEPERSTARSSGGDAWKVERACLLGYNFAHLRGLFEKLILSNCLLDRFEEDDIIFTSTDVDSRIGRVVACNLRPLAEGYVVG